MKIIIVGDGKVGKTLARELASENHDIVIVDTNIQALNETENELDVLTVCGNGASISILKEAGVSEADLLIAVTRSDELNLLSCFVAKKAGAKNTIARVRNPQYSKEIDFIKDDLGLSLSINPELAAALEISRLIRFPSALKIETFVKGRIEILKHHITRDSFLCGVLVSNIRKLTKLNVLVCAVERGDDVIIPKGNFTLLANDTISIISSPEEAYNFFKIIGEPINKIKNILIIGGGTLTYYVSKILINMGLKVKIIEKDKTRSEELSEILPDAMIINGDGTDHRLLDEEGICDIDAFASLTGMDEQNIILSMYAAKETPNAKIITKIKQSYFEDIIKNMDVGSVISPKHITSDSIVRYVRAMSNSYGSNVETLYKIVSNKAEALEFYVRTDADFLSVPLDKLKLKKNLLIACIIRNKEIITPSGNDTLQKGDSVIVVTTNKGLRDLADILA